MKLPIKLHTRLFLSISALIAVAMTLPASCSLPPRAWISSDNKKVEP